MLERTADAFGYAPAFLGKAGECRNILEQIKLTVLFVISTQILGMNIQKPFDPLLGETFQGYIGGIPVYLEQVSHQPSTSLYLMKCESFELFGCTHPKASMHFNSVTGDNVGTMNILFPKTNTKLFCDRPTVEVSGLLYGDRKVKLINKFHIICEAERLAC